MKDRKLIKYLRLMSPKELENFQKWLDIDEFNRNDAVKVLFRQLYKLEPRFPDTKLPTEDVLERSLNQSSTEFKRTCSNLTLLLVDYMAMLQLKKRPEVRDRLFLEKTETTLTQSIFFTKINLEQGRLERIKQQRKDHFLELYHLYHLEYFCPFFDKSSQRARKTISQMNNWLDKFYLLAKMEIECEGFNREKIYGAPWTAVLTKQLLGYFKSEMTEDSIFEFYNRIIQILRQSNAEYEIGLEILSLITKMENIYPSERQKMAVLLLNHYSFLRNSIDKKRWTGYFQLYASLVHNKDLYENKKLRPDHFLNLMSIGTDLEMIKDLKEIIQQHQPLQERNSQILADAYWYFATKKYDDVFDELEKITTHDSSFLFRIHPLKLRTIFEINPTEHIEAFEMILEELDTFNNSIQTAEKELGTLIEGSKNFIIYFKELAAAKFNKETLRPEFFNDIKECRPLICKIWFINQKKG